MWLSTPSSKRIRIGILCAAVVATSFIPETATTQAALVLDQRRNIKFGTFAADVNGGGTVVLNPNADSVSYTGPVTNFGGTVTRARFKIVGEPKAYVIITLPSSITIRKGSSNHYMTVDNFTMDQANPVKLNNQGKKTINIGATLHITTDQRQGNYNDENSFTYTVNYL